MYPKTLRVLIIFLYGLLVLFAGVIPTRVIAQYSSQNNPSEGSSINPDSSTYSSNPYAGSAINPGSSTYSSNPYTGSAVNPGNSTYSNMPYSKPNATLKESGRTPQSVSPAGQMPGAGAYPPQSVQPYSPPAPIVPFSPSPF